MKLKITYQVESTAYSQYHHDFEYDSEVSDRNIFERVETIHILQELSILRSQSHPYLTS